MKAEAYRRGGFREWLCEVGYLYLVVAVSLTLAFGLAHLAGMARAAGSSPAAPPVQGVYGQY
ncbi:MAG: hypothetical protein ABIL09_07580 [Gemmatimonadota bacterium]